MYVLTEDQGRLFDYGPQNSDVQLTVLNVWVSAETYRMLPAPAPVTCTHSVAATGVRFVVLTRSKDTLLAQQLLRRLAVKNYVISSMGENNFVP
jgi:hypothetical protein